MKPDDLGIRNESRERVLTDRELVALWNSSSAEAYPFGDLFKLLLLTGKRLNEAARAEWSEFDLERGLWTVPAVRMKGRQGRRKPSLTPLSPPLWAFWKRCPALVATCSALTVTRRLRTCRGRRLE